jgi:hypothetical protein
LFKIIRIPLANFVTMPSPESFLTYWYSIAEVCQASIATWHDAKVCAPHSPMQLVWKS